MVNMPHIKCQQECELEDKFIEVMRNNVAASSGYEAAESYGLSEEQRLKSVIVQLGEAGKREASDYVGSKAFLAFVGAALCSLTKDDLEALWFDFFVDFMDVSENAAITADNCCLSVMFENPKKDCFKVIKLLTHSLMPYLQKINCDFEFCYGFCAEKNMTHVAIDSLMTRSGGKPPDLDVGRDSPILERETMKTLQLTLLRIAESLEVKQEPPEKVETPFPWDEIRGDIVTRIQDHVFHCQGKERPSIFKSLKWPLSCEALVVAGVSNLLEAEYIGKKKVDIIRCKLHSLGFKNFH